MIYINNNNGSVSWVKRVASQLNDGSHGLLVTKYDQLLALTYV